MMIRIVGDLHGKIRQYINLVKGCENSLQIGDVGFDYSELKELDANRHKIIAGNHDVCHVDTEGHFIKQTPHFLGDFGSVGLGGLDFFYVRGGRSIDYKYRTLGVDFFRDEELTYARAQECLEAYSMMLPRVVISHECPIPAIDFVSKGKIWDGAPIQPSLTAHLLTEMFAAHAPDLWVHGHHHRDLIYHVGETKFVGLGELSYIDIG